MGNNRFFQVMALAAMAIFCSLALADPPSKVGRISAIEGQVTWRNAVTDENMAALINWPLTSRNQIETARLARAEMRVGSTVLSLDSDSKLDIEQLDDAHFKLRLHYGSIALRIKSRELLAEFELRTPQGRIWLTEPSTLRVDTERVSDASVISVFAGTAQFEGAGSRLPVRAGKRVEVSEDGIQTKAVMRDSFDDWNLAREEREQNSVSARYVSQETTGYEELDQYGTWEMSPEYGALWLPRHVSSNWVPYREGSWTWLEPWGWTWVDNAPWGYAPSHYGRWLWRRDRWCWAPGTLVARPVWTPALVGWVGEPNWSLSVTIGGSRRAVPARGWFPLAPREAYVPVYSVSPNYVGQVNHPHMYDGRDRQGRQDPRDWKQVPKQYQNRSAPNAITSLPHDQFVTRKTVTVVAPPASPRAVLQNPSAANAAPAPGPRRNEAEASATHGRSILHGRPDLPAPGPRRNEAEASATHGRSVLHGRPDLPAPALISAPTPTITALPPAPPLPAPLLHRHPAATPADAPPVTVSRPTQVEAGAEIERRTPPRPAEPRSVRTPNPAPTEIPSIQHRPSAPKQPEAQQRTADPSAPAKADVRVERKREKQEENNSAPAEPARQEQRNENRRSTRRADQ